MMSEKISGLKYSRWIELGVSTVAANSQNLFMFFMGLMTTVEMKNQSRNLPSVQTRISKLKFNGSLFLCKICETYQDYFFTTQFHLTMKKSSSWEGLATLILQIWFRSMILRQTCVKLLTWLETSRFITIVRATNPSRKAV